MNDGHSSAELRKLAEERLKEAQALLEAKRWSGARYLAGYAIELGLKAKAAKAFRRSHLPNREAVSGLYTHNLVTLLKAAELKRDLDQLIQSDPGVGANWGIASKWSEQDRYRVWSKSEAEAMVAAVGDPNDGILPWIMTHW